MIFVRNKYQNNIYSYTAKCRFKMHYTSQNVDETDNKMKKSKENYETIILLD